MGEKRKARMSNNERTSKKEKKSNKNVVLSSASNEEIEEQSSMHSNGSNSDSNSQTASIGQENTNPEEVEAAQAIPSIDVETVIVEHPIESPTSSTTTTVDQEKVANESTAAPNKSWWSSFVRFFHFGQTTSDNKPSSDHQTPTFTNGNYLGNVKCRRSLHNESLVG